MRVILPLVIISVLLQPFWILAAVIYHYGKVYGVF